MLLYMQSTIPIVTHISSSVHYCLLHAMRIPFDINLTYLITLLNTIILHRKDQSADAAGGAHTLLPTGQLPTSDTIAQCLN